LELNWFFDAYLHATAIPRLIAERSDDVMVFRWEAGGLPFPMPLEVRLGSEVHHLPMENGVGVLVVPDGIEPEVDPGMWVLMEYGGDRR
jgi:hypothetical protein